MGGMSGYFSQVDNLPNNLQQYVGGNTTAYSANQTGPGSPTGGMQGMFGFPGMFGGYRPFNPFGGYGGGFGGFGSPYGFMAQPMWGGPLGYNAMTQQMAGPSQVSTPAAGNPHLVPPPTAPDPVRQPPMLMGAPPVGFGGPDYYGGGDGPAGGGPGGGR